MTTLTASQVYWLTQHVLDHGANPTIMTAICRAESGANTTAISPTGDYGLWQINAHFHANLFKGHDWRDPNQNAWMAGQVFASQRYQAWATYNNGAYLRELAWARSGSANPAPVGGTAGTIGVKGGALDIGGQDVDTQLRQVSHELWYAGHDLWNYALANARYRGQMG